MSRAAKISYDVIVVGGGTAGALLANRLSATSSRVLLLEAGKSLKYEPWVHVPVGYLYCIGNARMDWRYTTEPAEGLGGRRLMYPRGLGLGGCSSINGMIYSRGQPRDYDRWSETVGDPAWKWENCMAEFLSHEDHHSRNDAVHRQGGEWRVAKQRLRWDILDAWAAAANQEGIPAVWAAATQDLNEALQNNHDCVGYFEVNQDDGWRWTTAKAFLGPSVTARPNLDIWTESRAESLVLEATTGGWRCGGVRVRRKNSTDTVTVSASRSVVLSAGSIGSAQLLQVSGIGPRDVLQAAGVPVLIERPGVGQNLQDHLQIRRAFAVQNTRTLNTRASSLVGRAAMALEYATRRTGPLSMAPSQLGAFARSNASEKFVGHPNVQFHVQPLSLEAFGQPLHAFDAFTASVCNLNPTSRGSVTIVSPDARVAPKIAPNYMSTPEDRRVAVESVRLARRIANQPALAPYSPVELKKTAAGNHGQNGLAADAAAELEDIALAVATATTIFHPVGTTKMGRPSDPMAVVDSTLRVLANNAGDVVHGLRVADAGIMPFITSGNTCSPTLMIAEKAARWIQNE